MNLKNNSVVICMDIPVQLENLMKVKVSKLEKHLFPNEYTVYKQAVEHCLFTLKELLVTEDNEIIIQCKDIGDEQILGFLNANEDDN